MEAGFRVPIPEVAARVTELLLLPLDTDSRHEIVANVTGEAKAIVWVPGVAEVTHS
jgi:hypothetical protein